MDVATGWWTAAGTACLADDTMVYSNTMYDENVEME